MTEDSSLEEAATVGQASETGGQVHWWKDSSESGSRNELPRVDITHMTMTSDMEKNFRNQLMSLRPPNGNGYPIHNCTA